MAKQAKIPNLSFRAAIDSNSYNAENNTVDVVFATEVKVRRYDWMEGRYFDEVLEISDAAIDFSRLRSGAAAVDSHNVYSLQNIIGVVTDARIISGEARATIRLSEEDADATTVNKIKKGIIRNVSVGYTVLEYTVTETQGEIPVYRATRWIPIEISFVAVPADAASGVRAENQEFHFAKIINPKLMEDDKKPAQQGERQAEPTPAPAPIPAPAAEPKSPAPAVDESAVRSAAVQEERKRVSDITSACIVAGLPSEFAQGLIDGGKDISEARAAVIDEVSKRSNPAPTGQGARVTGEDESVKIRTAVVDGLMARSIPGSVDLKGNEKASEYRNMRMIDIAKDRLRSTGVNYAMMNEQEIVKRAWATTDYPDLLTATFERSLRRFYEGTVDDWKFIARQESVSDFRQKTGITVDGSVSFEEIAEGGEYKESPILQNSKTSIGLKKYGRKYSISDIAIINDDLGVFSRLPRLMSIGAQQMQSNMVWALITGNAKAPDAKAIFHADHKNLASAGGAIAEATLSTGRVAMRKQTSAAGNRLGIKPKWLLVPPDLEVAAEKIVTSILATATGDVNVFANKLAPVVSDQLTDTKAWYLVADPATIIADGLVYAYLNGQPGLRLESRVNWDNDALEVKGSMAFAVAVWGWEGWYKNPGA